jgi:hypothetical protein
MVSVAISLIYINNSCLINIDDGQALVLNNGIVIGAAQVRKKNVQMNEREKIACNAN